MSTNPQQADQTRRALEDAERQFRERKRVEPPTLWGMIQSIHSDPLLRQWVTLESQPLIPLVTRDATGWFIHVALSAPHPNDPSRVQHPWSYVVWGWPEREIERIGKFPRDAVRRAELLSTDSVCTPEVAAQIEAAIERGKMPPPPDEIQRIFGDLMEPLVNYSELTPPEQEFPPLNATAPLANQFAGFEPVISRMQSLLGDDSAGRTELRRVRQRLNRRGFSVAIVGESRSGKTLIINRLFDRRLLAEAETTAPVRIVFGNEEALFIVRRNARPQRVPLPPEGATSHEGTAALLELRVNDARLRDANLKVLDTPGADSKNDRLTMEAISDSDAVLVAISALAPMGLSERVFIEQHILSRRVPRIAVVLTRLDKLPASDQAKVIEYAAKRLHDWVPEVMLGTMLDRTALPTDATVASAGPSECFNLLLRWSSDANHLHLLRSQACANLQQVAITGISAIEAQREALLLSEEERTTALKKAKEQLERARLDWVDVKIELDRRTLETGSAIRSFISEQKSDAVERLRFELRARPNLKSWWEQDLPFRLRQEMQRLGHDAEIVLHRRVADDVSWLQEIARKTFGQRLTASAVSEPAGPPQWRDLPTEPARREVKDLNQSRLYARLGIGGITVASYLLAGPFGIAVSIAGGLIGERMFIRQLDAQREELSAALDDVVSDLLCQAGRLIQTRLSGLYARLLEQIGRDEQQWLQARLRALQDSSKATTGEDSPAAALATRLSQWKALISDLQKLEPQTETRS